MKPSSTSTPFRREREEEVGARVRDRRPPGSSLPIRPSRAAARVDLVLAGGAREVADHRHVGVEDLRQSPTCCRTPAALPRGLRRRPRPAARTGRLSAAAAPPSVGRLEAHLCAGAAGARQRAVGGAAGRCGGGAARALELREPGFERRQPRAVCVADRLELLSEPVQFFADLLGRRVLTRRSTWLSDWSDGGLRLDCMCGENDRGGGCRHTHAHASSTDVSDTGPLLLMDGGQVLREHRRDPVRSGLAERRYKACARGIAT